MFSKKTLLSLLIIGFAATSCENTVVPSDCSNGECVAETSEFQAHAFPIINGTKVKDGELRSAVTLLSRYGAIYFSFCTGTLITPEWVLTAGHCVAECDNVEDDYTSTMVIGIGNSEKKAEHKYDYDKIIVHPDYICGDSKITGDIALVHLKTPVPATVAVPTPPMPDVPGIVLTASEVEDNYKGSTSSSNLEMTTVGFGMTDPYDAYSSGTKYKTTPAPFALCRLSGKQGKYCNDYRYGTTLSGFLYFDPEKTGTCSGDSGGPTFFTRNGREYVIAVSSWVLKNCAYLNAATFVPDYYDDFIAKHVTSGLPAIEPEDCENGVDDNADGLIDCLDPLCYLLPICIPEICDNDVDDNGDGLIDCKDPKCEDELICQPEICDNGQDDNGDGLSDCEDDECADFIKCQPEICDNGVDDNENGLIDCEDPTCDNALRCQPENCSNGYDDNGDGLIDCKDPQCSAEKRCQPEICDNGVDDNGNGLVDCQDTQCMGKTICLPEICDNGIDDNENGLMDCAEATCSTNAVCQPEICDNGVDDNKNGLTDCEEATCEEACASSGSDSCSAAPYTPAAPLAALPFLALPGLMLVRRRRRGN